MWKSDHVFDAPIGPLADTDEGAALWLLTWAKRVFLTDGYHASIAFLLKEQHVVSIRAMSTQNQSRKRYAQRNLAKHVVATGADAVVSVSEAWLGVTTEFTGKESVAQMPDRTEILLLMLASRNSDAVMFSTPIHRNPSGLSLGETCREQLGAPIMFSAVYKAWGMEVPDMWDRDVEHADGAIAVRIVGGTKAN